MLPVPSTSRANATAMPASSIVRFSPRSTPIASLPYSFFTSERLFAVSRTAAAIVERSPMMNG